MEQPLVLALSPYSFVSVPLFIAGSVFTWSLFRFKDKTAATWYLMLSLAAFTLGMAALFVATAVVFWGGAFWAAQDGFAVAGMAALIQFAYHYPRRERSLEGRLAGLFSIGIVALALGFSLWYAFQFFATRSTPPVGSTYSLLMPFAFLVALGVSARRTVRLHRQELSVGSPFREGSEPGTGRMLSAFRRPAGHARVLRNFCLALSLGLLQGIASTLGVQGLIAPPLEAYAIGFSLLAMIVAIVYSTWDHVTRQPSLNVKLTGLSLVTLLAILGAIGQFVVHEAVVRETGERELLVEIVRRAHRTGDLESLPEAVVYVLAVPSQSPGGPREDPRPRPLYLRAGFDSGPLLEEIGRQRAGLPPPTCLWNYYSEVYLLGATPPGSIGFYFGGDSPPGLRRYVSYPLKGDGDPLEVGFSLGESASRVNGVAVPLVWMVVSASLFILLVFPLFFRASIAAPLSNLLRGVARADAGDLEVAVPPEYDDEIGRLTRSFNGMVRSIKAELAERLRLEKELQGAYADLERRIEERTADLTREVGDRRAAEEALRTARDELSVLYQVSSTASQAGELETRLAQALARSLQSLQAEMGEILLLGDTGDAPQPGDLRAVASRGIPLKMPAHQSSLLGGGPFFAWVARRNEPLLILDISLDPRVPLPMRQLGNLGLLMAPMRADGRVLGAIGVIRDRARPFSASEVALLGTIADQLGLTVRSERLRKQAAVLEERERLGRDLHDSVIQSLYAVNSFADATEAQLEAGSLEAAKHTLGRIAEATRQSLREMRLLLHQLRPPELKREGLVATLHSRFAAVEGRSGPQARLLADEELRLPPPVEYALYLVAQEALNNSLRHAQATTVTAGLRREAGEIVLEVVDDGRGFDPAAVRPGGMGLRNMRERAAQVEGRLEVASSPGLGTRVTVRIEEVVPWLAASGS